MDVFVRYVNVPNEANESYIMLLWGMHTSNKNACLKRKVLVSVWDLSRNIVKRGFANLKVTTPWMGLIYSVAVVRQYINISVDNTVMEYAGLISGFI